jgi:prevent-host-death family protein
MRTAAVASLKAQLSKFLRLVKAGEEILVTDRDVPVAKIVPVGQPGPGEESLRDLERQGLLRVGTGRLPKGFWSMPRGKDPKSSIRTAVRDDRDRGW